tara:strand:+ start:263 stop:721 length:459 start_codon:yes stop_codon:yes gene_type:complete
MSNEMKLIMESWRSTLLLEADEKKIKNFISGLANGTVTDEQANKVFSDLLKRPGVKELAQTLDQLDDLPANEGLYDDAMASLYVKGTTLLDAFKQKPGGEKLIKATPAILALAYAAVKFSQGDFDAGSAETVLKLLDKGVNIDLIDFAAAGG